MNDVESAKTMPLVRTAALRDLEAIRRIYNEGIADHATLDETDKSDADMATWWSAHSDRYAVLVAEDRVGEIVGWASLNPYSHRCAYDGVADLSIYVARSRRGSGVGAMLLASLERRANELAFHKIVLSTIAGNARGHALYTKLGYREVGIFREQGKIAGAFVDVLAMEKILRPFVLFVCRHNTGRSQMAEAFLRAVAGETIGVASAGTLGADGPNPGVVAAMAEVGIDIASARPKLLDPIVVARADHIITMGCDVEGVPRIDDDWGLPDPKDQPAVRVREIRDLVLANVERLAARLNAP